MAFPSIRRAKEEMTEALLRGKSTPYFMRDGVPRCKISHLDIQQQGDTLTVYVIAESGHTLTTVSAEVPEGSIFRIQFPGETEVEISEP